MASQSKKIKDALLVDLKQSITKALDERMPDLASALYRLQGSAEGWCDLESCGMCPLAPRMCVNDLEEKVHLLIEEHHAKKSEIAQKPEIAQKNDTKFSATFPSPGKSIKKKVSPLPVSRYFERLQDILSNHSTVLHHNGAATSRQKLDWQKVNDTFTHSLPHTMAPKHDE